MSRSYNLGENVRYLRKLRGISKTELGHTVGFYRLALIETNRYDPSIRMLENIAQRLDVPVYVLLLEGETDLDTRIRSMLAPLTRAEKWFIRQMVINMAKVIEGYPLESE